MRLNHRRWRFRSPTEPRKTLFFPTWIHSVPSNLVLNSLTISPEAAMKRTEADIGTPTLLSLPPHSPPLPRQSKTELPEGLSISSRRASDEQFRVKSRNYKTQKAAALCQPTSSQPHLLLCKLPRVEQFLARPIHYSSAGETSTPTP